jgi:hypothetical protein
MDRQRQTDQTRGRHRGHGTHPDSHGEVRGDGTGHAGQQEQRRQQDRGKICGPDNKPAGSMAGRVRHGHSESPSVRGHGALTSMPDQGRSTPKI